MQMLMTRMQRRTQKRCPQRQQKAKKPCSNSANGLA
jgi:hypothetical protein